ncbi:methyl-accepting chemotaxis protein [Thiomonas sp.]|uniref:methyl-accepting chemotaxis protein n=1 Tax=Thiomonas sp. TaxID=2047785 RepID=UPI002629DDFB|nr:methyl-accepting chemotaxis protein [Thiomonas sp.]
MSLLSSLFGTKNKAAQTDTEIAPTAFARNGQETLQIDSSLSDPTAALAQAQGGKPLILRLPQIGRMQLAQQQRFYGVLLIISLVLLGLTLIVVLRGTSDSARQIESSGAALTQSQRLARAMNAALLGNKDAFGTVRSSADALKSAVDTLRNSATSVGARPLLDKISTETDISVKNANLLLKQQDVLTTTAQQLSDINRQTDALLDSAQTLTSLLLQLKAPASDINAASQLAMLTQRIDKSANAFLSFQGVRPEAVFSLGKDLSTFNDLSKGLLNGNSDLQLTALSDPQARQQLQQLIQTYAKTEAAARSLLANLPGLAAARQAQAAVLTASGQLYEHINQLQTQYLTRSGVNWAAIVFIIVLGVLAIIAATDLIYIMLNEARQRAALVEMQRRQSERLELEARRTNESNQAAILRLMNELQTVAEGDLTQQATVTEDITGAIADSVNYTVEELRNLVAQVQQTADQVGEGAAQAQTTSDRLMQQADEQLKVIRETGQSVLDMAQHIQQVSVQAQQSAEVANQSLQAAAQGQRAVRNSIDGMNSIREQIQDTSKRIKRLGESSQEIGEITELISDITEQTNVLALNAAIQAASAGEAGRGFSVVAEEVQRLAERSAESAKQIAALVRTIQTDTQDAVAAMEKSTQGVVEGAKLADNAGAALAQIDQVSRQLADLITRIAQQTQDEAASANKVAENIQTIFTVTEQTSEGTRSTAALVRELARVADDLRQSVSRFKIQ